MCLVRKKKKESISNPQPPPPAELPVPKSSIPATAVAAPKTIEVPIDNRLDLTQREDGIANIHHKMKQRRSEKNTTLDVDKRRHELEETQKALGKQPNTALIDRLAQRTKQLDPVEEHSNKSTASKSSDISFKLKRFKDDDTHYPERKKKALKTSSAEPNEDPNAGCSTPILEGEEFVEDDEASEPNDQADLGDVAGDCTIEKNCEVTEWNPFLPLAQLEGREQFCCQTLRKNTFISNSLAMPTVEEKKSLEKVVEPLASKVVVKTQPMDLSKFASNFHEASLITAPTEQSVSKRPGQSSRVANVERKKASTSKRKTNTS